MRAPAAGSPAALIGIVLLGTLALGCAVPVAAALDEPDAVGSPGTELEFAL